MLDYPKQGKSTGERILLNVTPAILYTVVTISHKFNTMTSQRHRSEKGWQFAAIHHWEGGTVNSMGQILIK